jgi:hypothetical protein
MRAGRGRQMWKAFNVVALILCGVANAAENRDTKQDFDLACAVMSGAKMGAVVQNGVRINVLSMLMFYLGRLSARDDTQAWNKIVLDRAGELHGKELDEHMLESCAALYVQKTE